VKIASQLRCIFLIDLYLGNVIKQVLIARCCFVISEMCGPFKIIIACMYTSRGSGVENALKKKIDKLIVELK